VQVVKEGSGYKGWTIVSNQSWLLDSWWIEKNVFHDGDMFKLRIPVPHIRTYFDAPKKKWFELWIDMGHPPAKIFNRKTLSIRYLARLEYMSRKHDIPLTSYNELMIMEKFDLPTKFIPQPRRKIL
jgi:hypothetical protein